MKTSKTIILTVLGFFTFSPLFAQDFWRDVSAGGSQIKSGSLQLLITGIEPQDVRPLEVIRSEAEDLANKAEISITSGWKEGKDKKQLKQLVELTKQGIIENALRRAGEEKREEHEFTLIFSGNSFKIIPDRKSLQDESRGILYSNEKMDCLYYPKQQRMIIDNNRGAVRIGAEFAQVAKWLKPGRLPDKMKDQARLLNITNEGNMVVINFSSHGSTTKYTISPQLAYAINSMVFHNTKGERLEVLYENYSSSSPYIPKTITSVFSSGKHIVSKSISTLLNGAWNLEINDSTFLPESFPLITVQDNRFNPSLFYKAKGQLPSDEEIVRFKKNPALLDQHNQQLEKFNP